MTPSTSNRIAWIAIAAVLLVTTQTATAAAASRCRGKKLVCAGKLVQAKTKCLAKPGLATDCLAKAGEKHVRCMERAETTGDCGTVGDAGNIQATLDTCLTNVVGQLATDAGESRYRDENDGGDNPFAGGCHYGYSDADCTTGRFFWTLDYCTGPRTLVEWTDATCHVPMPLDSKTYDCDAECRAQGFRSGLCTNWPVPCEGGPNPAHCRCFD